MYSAGGMPFCINNNVAGGVTAISLDKRDTAAGCSCGDSGTCQYSLDGTLHCVGPKAARGVTI